MIKVILWDIDGTVLDFKVAEKAAVRRCFEIFGLGDCSDEMLAVYSEINVRYWKMLERGEMTKPQILKGRFEEFFRLYGLRSDVAEAFNGEYQIRLGDTICFYENALETVLALRGKTLQCAVTNGTKLAQVRKLSESGLDKIFDHIFISEEVGAEKPSAAFFDKVFGTIGDYEKSEILIVGDSLTSDIRGGNDSGILTCWFNPDNKINSSGEHTDFVISNIAEVAEIIERS